MAGSCWWSNSHKLIFWFYLLGIASISVCSFILSSKQLGLKNKKKASNKRKIKTKQIVRTLPTKIKAARFIASKFKTLMKEVETYRKRYQVQVGYHGNNSRINWPNILINLATSICHVILKEEGRVWVS